MAQPQLTYPNSLINQNKFNAHLYPSKYPTYAVYKAGVSTITGTYPSNKYLNFSILIQYQNVPQDITFTINGVRYSNSTIINGRNIFLKSGDFDKVENSLYNMFLLNGMLEWICR